MIPCGDLEDDEGMNVADVARRLFGPENGVDLDLQPRLSGREPPDFSQ